MGYICFLWFFGFVTGAYGPEACWIIATAYCLMGQHGKGIFAGR